MIKYNIAVVGLGYVGLPLAVEFGKKYPTLGFDINTDRLAELQQGHDRTLEVDGQSIADAKNLHFSNLLDDLKVCLAIHHLLVEYVSKV